MPGSIRLTGSGGIRSASGAVGGEDLSAFVGAGPAMTSCEPALGRTGAFGMSWSASAQAAVLRQKFLKMQHHAGQRTDDREAGSSGLVGPQYRPL